MQPHFTQMGEMSGWDAFGLVVGLLVWGAVAVGFVWFMRAWSPARVLDRLAKGASSAWVGEMRFGRRMLLRSLMLREEAAVELDGARLDLADEMLREDLHFLGGLAGVW
ncbi:hypothetical protein [Ralstonia pseudosolanacearum]|uniref:Uncharacterized protein n=1 Tax=Ralstonia solanacearum TaxID=305 RepID=A0AA92EBN5_RALSL|nr:hypothetical protein [Ralstonia pseudosolanacearum]QCX48953.1 hypothetical protein E7Z57_07425 [Ralstonia pseudosolanacearum]